MRVAHQVVIARTPAKPGDVAIQACGCGLCRTCRPGLLRLRLAMTVECERVRTHLSLGILTEAGVTGAVPPPRRLRGGCKSTLDSEVLGIAPAGLPMRALRSKGGRGIWSGWHHCPWKGIPPPASPGATPHDAVRKLRSWPEVTPEGLETSPPVVRVAPLHDGGITARPRKPHAEICTLWAKLPSHAC